MTIEEAIRAIKHDLHWNLLKGYQEDVAKIAISALEKQIPKKPNGTRCPICKRALRKAKIENGYTGRVKTRNADDYCPKCGQALDWSVTDD